MISEAMAVSDTHGPTRLVKLQSVCAIALSFYTGLRPGYGAASCEEDRDKGQVHLLRFPSCLQLAQNSFPAVPQVR